MPEHHAHDRACCGRDPILGARYRRRQRDPITGLLGTYRIFRVLHVEQIRHDRLFCRRVHLLCEATGRVYKPQVATFWADCYEAIDNIVALRTVNEVR